MNTLKTILNLTAALALVASVTAAENTIKYVAKPGCRVSIDGTSTIHDWTTKGAIIGGSFEVESAFQTDKSLKSVKSLTTKESNPKVDVKIPITSLKSTVMVASSKMDEVMREAMHAKENPTILYSVKEMIVKGDVPESGTPVKFDTKGDLMISGVTNTVDMEVTMDRLPDDKIKFAGSKVLKMTDFKIKPPAPSILGMAPIKTGDEVTIKFEWLLGLMKPAATEAK